MSATGIARSHERAGSSRSKRPPPLSAEEIQARVLYRDGLILVVEDEAMVRDVLESAVTGLGYKVVSAVDGEDAMRVYQEHRHRITGVVLDLKMPKKGGVEVFREILDRKSVV